MISGATPRVDPFTSRRLARDIVSSRRFRPEEVPKPLEGVLEWIGDRLSPIGRLFDPVFELLESGPARLIFAILLIAVVAAIAYGIATRRTARADRHRGTGPRDATILDPSDLERMAADAEATGDLDRAIRLRFRAGLLRLDRAGAITYRPSLTSSQVARTLHSQDFEALSTTFDAVVYGGHPAGRDDIDEARARWSRLLADTRSS